MESTFEDQYHPAIMIEGIQPFGCLIRFDAYLQKVFQVSANLQKVLGVSIDEALVSSAGEILGSKLQYRLQQALAKNLR